MKITAHDIRGVVGILPSPATAGAERWDAIDTVNLPETEKMVRAVVDAGVDIIMTTGTFGECATLTWPELQSLVDCVVQTAARRKLVFAGVTTLNTRDTIERGRALVALGADGLFVGRPMWIALDDAQIVAYYRDIAAALPGVPIVAYPTIRSRSRGRSQTMSTRNLRRSPKSSRQSMSAVRSSKPICERSAMRFASCRSKLIGRRSRRFCRTMRSRAGRAQWHVRPRRLPRSDAPFSREIGPRPMRSTRRRTGRSRRCSPVASSARL